LEVELVTEINRNMKQTPEPESEAQEMAGNMVTLVGQVEM